nr:reverse transcriptase domain-containing protein [Tanacetum cinerariifolium]
MASKIAAQDLEIASLKARIKLLEDKDGGVAKPSGEDATIKGRSLETRKEAGVDKSTERALVSVPPAAEVSTISVPTGSGMVPTASPIFTTASVVTPYLRQKGKEKIVESDTPKKKKLQEQIDVQMAREIEESIARSFYHPHQTVPETDPTEPSHAPLRNEGSDLEVDNLGLEGVAPELATKYEASPPRHRKERHERDSRRPLVFTRIGKKVVGDQTADLQYLGTHENNGWRTNVYARLGSHDVHDRLRRRRSLSKSPPSSDSEDSRRKRRKRVSSSSCDSSDNEDEETGHWKSRNGYLGNARNWFSKLPRRSINGFEELQRAFRLNFTQRKKCAKNPVKLARVKQRQGESTSAYVEDYKDECIHVKACLEILKISGFMNGINNPELIRRLNDRVPQTFDELMKHTRSFIQGQAAAADSKKSYSNYKSQE